MLSEYLKTNLCSNPHASTALPSPIPLSFSQLPHEVIEHIAELSIDVSSTYKYPRTFQLGLKNNAVIVNARHMMISITATDKAIFTDRFYHPTLQRISVNCKSTVVFFTMLEAMQDPLNPYRAIRRPEDLQLIKQLILKWSSNDTKYNFNLLIKMLPSITMLEFIVHRTALPQTLPEFLAAATSLKALKSLSIAGNCSQTKVGSLPRTIGYIDGLETLTLRHFYHLHTLPRSISQLTQLKTLVLEHLPKLRALSKEIWQMSGLQSLTLRETMHIEVPPNVLPQLKINQL